MGDVLNLHQFAAYDVPAPEIQVGDKLDPRGRNHVHTVHAYRDQVLLGYSSKGTRSGSVKSHHNSETVRVWRKPDAK